MKTKDEYIASLASELKEWSAQIDVLTGQDGKRRSRAETQIRRRT